MLTTRRLSGRASLLTVAHNPVHFVRAASHRHYDCVPTNISNAVSQCAGNHGSAVYQPLRTWARCQAAHGGSGSSGANGNDQDYMQALQEAADIYAQAETLARLQTHHELIQDGSLNAGFEAAGKPISETNIKTSSSTEAAVEAFWWEQGLPQAHAARLTSELFRNGQQYSTQQLAALLQRWQQVLPGLDVVKMVGQDCRLLDADISLAISNMVVLVQALPGHDLTDILSKQPQLLWCQDLESRAQRVVDHLLRLHPSGDREVVGTLIADNPELLFRLDYYMSATILDDLPVYIQNMMVLSDSGLGFVHRYWKGRRAGAQHRDVPFDGGFDCAEGFRPGTPHAVQCIHRVATKHRDRQATYSLVATK